MFTTQRESTKWIIDSLIQGTGNWKTFDNLNRALLATNDIDKGKFWGKVGFYNFIQEPMKSKKDRPRKDDFLKGFECLKKLIIDDEFDTALFLGTTAVASRVGCNE